LSFLSKGLCKLEKLHGKKQRLRDENVLSDAGQHMVSARKGSVLRRSLRILAAALMCVCLLIVGGIASAYVILQGKSDSGSALLSRIESSIEEALGPRFDVVIQTGETDLSSFGRVSFVAHEVIVNDLDSNQVAGSIGNVQLEANWLGYISGDGSFDHIRISEVVIQASTLLGNGVTGLPPHLDVAVNSFGRFLGEINSAFDRNNLKTLELSNVSVVGPVLGRRSNDPVRISALDFKRDVDSRIVSSGAVQTEASNISVKSTYQVYEEQGSSYDFDIVGINLREWSLDPKADEGFVAMDGMANFSGSVRFDESGNAADPVFKLSTGVGMVRLGKFERSEITSLDMNLRVFLDKNQIELERSYVHVGSFSGLVAGGLKPVNQTAGYSGSILYDFIIEHGEYLDEKSNEKPVPGAFQAAGVFSAAEKRVDVNKIIFTTKGGAVTGSANIGLAGETPSVKGKLSTKGIQVTALKQFWPFFVAAAARNWVLDHIHEGWVESGTVFADIPPGILFNLREGAKLLPEHYRTQFQVRDLSFRPFGEMPRIEKATGEVILEGMKIEARLTSGVAEDGAGKTVKIRKGSFLMPDFAAKNRIGETHLELDGDIKAIARISDRKPLRVMERMKASPDQFSGKGHANVAAIFPIGRKIAYDEVDWNVLLELENGRSTKALEGRKFSNANLLFDASSTGAKVSGTAAIDGVQSRIEIVQPIGKSGKVKSRRKIVTTLGAKDREKLGFDLRPVIEGPVGLSIERANGKETHTLNFTDAKISLPWIGWSKGKGIAANGRFELARSKGNYILRNFQLKGAGFEGVGELVLSRRGLISANLSKVKLNETDDVRLNIKRAKDAYNINVTGLSYDARSIINTLVHSGGFSKAQGGRSVNLVANFETIRGFNNRIMRNAILLYESRNGQLTRLDISAVGSDGRKYNVQAQLSGNDTLFTMGSNDAGNALAFTDIYTRMEGGQLSATLLQSESGPFLGPVRIKQFDLINEPRLARLA